MYQHITTSYKDINYTISNIEKLTKNKENLCFASHVFNIDIKKLTKNNIPVYKDYFKLRNLAQYTYYTLLGFLLLNSKHKIFPYNHPFNLITVKNKLFFVIETTHYKFILHQSYSSTHYDILINDIEFKNVFISDLCDIIPLNLTRVIKIQSLEDIE